MRCDMRGYCGATDDSLAPSSWPPAAQEQSLGRLEESLKGFWGLCCGFSLVALDTMGHRLQSVPVGPPGPYSVACWPLHTPQCQELLSWKHHPATHTLA